MRPEIRAEKSFKINIDAFSRQTLRGGFSLSVVLIGQPLLELLVKRGGG